MSDLSELMQTHPDELAKDGKLDELITILQSQRRQFNASGAPQKSGQRSTPAAKPVQEALGLDIKL